ncbi:MAG TPA: right-handed parallel beta-helix repeat-containing protein [Coleofasciculaceae cyanobacterium]|jgi:hypothetical protein
MTFFKPWQSLLTVGVTLSSLMLAMPRGEAFTATVNIPQICAQNCAQINVTQAGILPNDGVDDAPHLNQLLKTASRNTILYFPAGRYELGSGLHGDQLNNVSIVGETGAELVKTPAFKDEYLFYSRFSRNVGIRNLIFRGNTSDRTQYRWGESGLYFGSSDGVVVENSNFYDFGDAAIRVTTSRAGAQGTHSHNATVRNNYFENVTQITTTSNQNRYGGTNGFFLYNNVFRHLKGTVKFATRTPGAGQIIVRNNSISGVPSIPTSNGIEVVSYSNVFLENNLIADCGGFGMNIYTNTGPGIDGFDWGNYLIRNNTITRCAKGIRVSVSPYRNGYVPQVSTITIENNRLQVAAPQAIQLLNGHIRNAVVQGNNRT